MTAKELRDLIKSSDFTLGLEEMSSYLASIMQERPIIYLLAKCLWKKKCKFELEDKRQDLFLNDKRIEFKFNYDRGLGVNGRKELEKYGDNIQRMWEDAKAKVTSKSWGVLAKVYEDMCVKDPAPAIFVWIICSRDLSKVADEDL